MKCPKCYGKVDINTQRCMDCGFSTRLLEGATHKEVRQARKDGFGEDVLYTNILPKDIKKKKLLLLCIFLGLFGGHNYYVGKIIQAVIKTVIAVNMFAVGIYVTIKNMPLILFSNAFNVVYAFSLLLMGFNMVIWLYDILQIVRGKYKVSVYRDEFSK